eukprot:6200624-Pleurochrysis_carterae.AAC.1
MRPAAIYDICIPNPLANTSMDMHKLGRAVRSNGSRDSPPSAQPNNAIKAHSKIMAELCSIVSILHGLEQQQPSRQSFRILYQLLQAVVAVSGSGASLAQQPSWDLSGRMRPHRPLQRPGCGHRLGENIQIQQRPSPANPSSNRSLQASQPM